MFNGSKLLRILSWLGVFLIPFISLPVLPSTYRPVSVFFLLIPALVFFVHKNVVKVRLDYYVLFFLIYIIVHGGLFALFSDGFDYFSYFKEFVVILSGAVVYFGFRFVFEAYGLHWFASVSNLSYKILLLIGVIEVLAVLGVIPFSIKETMNMALSGKAHERIQFTTMEASWGARVLLFAFAIYLFTSKDRREVRLFFVMLGLLLLLFTFSVAVFGFLILAIFIYFIYLFKFKGMLYSFLLVMAAYLLLILSLGLFSELGFGGYYLNRIDALLSGDFYHVSDMLLYDQSIFIRLGYPFLALYIYMDNLMGVGIGQYGRYFNDYLVELYGAGVLQFPEVFDDVYSNEGDARSLLFKIIVDTSLLGFFIFMAVLHIAFKDRNVTSLDKFKVFFMILAMASSITTGSWAYLYFWIAFAMMPANEGGVK